MCNTSLKLKSIFWITKERSRNPATDKLELFVAVGITLILKYTRNKWFYSVAFWFVHVSERWCYCMCTYHSGFPTDVENVVGQGVGGLFKIWWGGLSQYMGGAWGGGLKMLSKNTYERVHFIVKLPAISLQARKFTKNELLHTYFWRILARF